MIIETDLPDHWKIEALILSCGESALRCLLRLWAFAQIRKSDLLPKRQLEAIAKFQGQKGLFFSSLLELNLIEELGEDEENFQNLVRLHDYAEVNRSLFVCWKNGDRKASEAKGKQCPSGVQAKGKRSGSDGQAKHKRTASETEAKTERDTSEDEALPKQCPSGGEAVPEQCPSNPLSSAQAIDKIDKIDKILTPPTPLRVACAENFELGLFEKLGAELSPEDIKRLQDKFAEWVEYRKTVKRKPIKPETARRHGKRVADCIDIDELSVEQVLEMFDKSMAREWQDWCFDEEILKKKASGEKKFNKNSAPAPLGVPLGAWQNEEPSVGM